MATNEDIDSVIERLKKSIDNAQNNKATFNSGINTKLTAINARLDALYDKIQSNINKLNELKQKTNSNDVAISHHNENINDLEKQLSDAKSEKETITDQLKTANEQLERKEEQIKGLEEAQQGNSAKLAEQLEELTKSIKEKEQNINALNEEIRKTNDILEYHKSNVQELTETNAALREKLGRGIQAIVSAIDTLENLSQDDSNSDATIEQINASIEKISNLLSGENDEGPGPELGPFSGEPSFYSESSEGPFSSPNPVPTQKRRRERGQPVPLNELGVSYRTRGGKTHRRRKNKTHRRGRSHRGGYTYRRHSKRQSLTTPRSRRTSRRTSRKS